MSGLLAASVYRPADFEVLIAVAQTPQGPAPLLTDVDGEITRVADTELREAQADVPATHRLFSIVVVADLLGQLPEHVGLVVYDVEGQSGADARAADLVVEAARSTECPRPLLLLALDDLPVEHRQWLLANTPPFYERRS